jgi:CheY-like chemotaxis protein
MSAVLVIEDDDRIRLSLVLALEDEGYTVTGASTAEEGVALQRNRPADTVLVDLMLPGIDGFECIRQLRRTDDVPIVVVSAREDTHDIVAALEAGADDYLVKPIAIPSWRPGCGRYAGGHVSRGPTRSRCIASVTSRSCRMPARSGCGASWSR